MGLLSKKDSLQMSFVEKRAFKRVNTDIDARFFYGNLFYSGKVINISEKGMFITTKRCLDTDTMFVIIIREDQELLKVIAKVKRVSNYSESCSGMGVELLSPSADFLNFLTKLKLNAL